MNQPKKIQLDSLIGLENSFIEYDNKLNEVIVVNKDSTFRVDIEKNQIKPINLHSYICNEKIDVDKEIQQNITDDSQSNLKDFNINYTSMRFVPYFANTQRISQSGYVVNATSFTEEYAVANMGFNRGKPYWEIICPINCSDIKIGVIEDGFNQIKPNGDKKLISLITFNTTTPRIVGLQIDFSKRTLYCWLNGNFQNHKIKNLQEGKTYFPYVELTSNGNQVILNPYCCDIKNKLSIFEPVECNILTKQLDYDIDASQSKLLQALKKVKIDSNFSNHTLNLFPSEIFYVKKNDNYLVVRDNKFKLVRKLKNQTLKLSPSLFQNKPQTIESQIYLEISHEDLLFILQNTEKFQKKEHVKNFFDQAASLIKNSIQSIKSAYLIKLSFKDAKFFVNELLNNVLQKLQKYEQTKIKDEKEVEINYDQNLNEMPFNDLFGEAIESEPIQDQEKPIIKNEQILSTDILHNILRIMLNLDEQLFAMIQHSQANQQLRDFFVSKTSRVFTAFSRLGSFMNYPMSKEFIIELAENGLFNQNDYFYELRHFLDQDIDLTDFHLPENQQLSIEESLKIQLPENRMANGWIAPNVDLQTTINNLPYQEIQLDDPDDKIIMTHVLNESNYVCSISQKGIIQIWNTELALVKVFKNNFKEQIAKYQKQQCTDENDETKQIYQKQQNTFY